MGIPSNGPCSRPIYRPVTIEYTGIVAKAAGEPTPLRLCPTSGAKPILLARSRRSIRMKNWFRRVLLLDVLAGLRVTFRQQKPSGIVTEQYPAERPAVAERYRGAPRLNINPDNGETLCIACDLCAIACPEKLILVGSERDPKTKHKVLTTFTYDLSRCMFCGLCEDACPVDALELTQDFEMATFTRQGAIWDRQMLEEGPHPAAYRH